MIALLQQVNCSGLYVRLLIKSSRFSHALCEWRCAELSFLSRKKCNKMNKLSQGLYKSQKQALISGLWCHKQHVAVNSYNKKTR